MACISALGKRNNSHEEANRSFTLHAFLHGKRESTTMKKCIKASGSTHFCIGEKNHIHEEANRSFMLHAFLHGKRESTTMEKCTFHAFLHMGRKATAMENALKIQVPSISSQEKRNSGHGEADKGHEEVY